MDDFLKNKTHYDSAFSKSLVSKKITNKTELKLRTDCNHHYSLSIDKINKTTGFESIIPCENSKLESTNGIVKYVIKDKKEGVVFFSFGRSLHVNYFYIYSYKKLFSEVISGNILISFNNLDTSTLYFNKPTETSVSYKNEKLYRLSATLYDYQLAKFNDLFSAVNPCFVLSLNAKNGEEIYASSFNEKANSSDYRVEILREMSKILQLSICDQEKSDCWDQD